MKEQDTILKTNGAAIIKDPFILLGREINIFFILPRFRYLIKYFTILTIFNPMQICGLFAYLHFYFSAYSSGKTIITFPAIFILWRNK